MTRVSRKCTCARACTHAFSLSLPPYFVIHTHTNWLNSLTLSLTHRCVEDLAEAQKRISSQEKVNVNFFYSHLFILSIDQNILMYILSQCIRFFLYHLFLLTEVRAKNKRVHCVDSMLQHVWHLTQCCACLNLAHFLLLQYSRPSPFVCMHVFISVWT
jgi:hypothetical protein